MYYCSLRDSVEYAGWGEKLELMGQTVIEPFTAEWSRAAVERSIQAAGEILAGRIAPAPSDLSLCRLCDFRDVCRFETATAAVAEGA